jgi:hypothetical protein
MFVVVPVATLGSCFAGQPPRLPRIGSLTGRLTYGSAPPIGPAPSGRLIDLTFLKSQSHHDDTSFA